ncbi:MAG: prepilin-type N-terminal cleavage/methylation domain-containing protein [Candidatus Pacebacteria bacterium]|nr:prepilin-type N-terminal cleavage/methylation domain-containing protein [Candidatus Paceibacterota bacterium]
MKYLLKKYISVFQIQHATRKEFSRGFTLIEMMISVALFTIVMIFGVGSLLTSNNSYHQTENLRKVIDNLSFSVEDIARTMRVGTNYVCGGMKGIDTDAGTFPPVYSDTTIGFDSINCPFGGGSIMFESAEGDPLDDHDQYGFLMLYDLRTQKAKLYKTINGGFSWMLITPPSVYFNPIASGFTVVGVRDDDKQPLVMFHLSGNVEYKNIVTTFNLQTSVSQRALEE